ncbi:MarR family transcriptional regulator [Burkholderia sp. WAC0059]|uniref:efflux transporter outer membrane subunit n=1 Tax=Burkholderia sp. WAC0059 TaxID=2066022 RepID=UPI000C7F0B1A|nr:efflux transporter outer membrane subunit [Burkholderia sp. WAC0059]PLZ04418.1 MarR family transcriptional regulator [Burkholderia sp. WAC0059]
MHSLFTFAPARPGRAAVAAAVAALALSGCANYFGIGSNKTLTPPTQLETSRSIPAQGGQWPTLDWANQFGDPQLPKLIDEALANNPSIAEAQARIARASAYIETSRSALLPKVNGSYSWTREIYSAHSIYPPPYGGTWYSENNVLANASWDLDLWGKNRQRLHEAVSQERAAEADMQQARLTLASTIARTYNQLAQLYALRDIAVHEIDNRRTIGSITNGRVLAGLDSSVEQQTANGNIATSQANLGQIDGQIESVRYQLGALLGKGPDRGLQIANPVLDPVAQIALPDNLPADLVARRPDIVAARWQVEAAMHGVKEAKAEFYPDVNLAAGFGFDALGWGSFLTSAARQTDIGPAVHLPIFDAGALRAQLKSRYADFDLDVADYNQTLIGAFNDIATEVSAIRSTDRQLVDAQHALDASTNAWQLAVIRYRAGLSEQLQVLVADQNRLAAEQSVTNLRMQRRDMQMALIRSLGGGFDATQTGLAAPAEIGSDHAGGIVTPVQTSN